MEQTQKLSRAPFVLGGAQSDFARNWSRENTGVVPLLREVVEAALESTRLDYANIRKLRDENRVGVFVGNFNGEKFFNQGHLGAFLTEVDSSFYGVPGARYEAACASGSVALDAARAKIAAGDIDLALVVGIEMMKTVNPVQCNDYLGLAADYENEARGVRFIFPRVFGTLTDVIIEQYPEAGEARVMAALSAISGFNYQNAKRNPKAQTREQDLSELPKLDQKYAKSFGGRTRYSDCSQVTDGAAAVFLASNEFTRDYKAERDQARVARLSGWGHRVAPLRLDVKLEQARAQREGANLGLIPHTTRAVNDALARARIRKDDVDVIETHDCFTSSEYLAVSAFGLSEPGREYEAVEDGRITGLHAGQGKRPINPSGGLIGAGHPVGATGVRMMLDLYRQVSDQAGDYQVADARRGAMLNIGGSFTTNMTFVVERDPER